MPYILRALVARCEVFANPLDWSSDSAVIALPQGFCMLPLSQALCYRFGPADRPWLYPSYSIFTNLPEGLVPHLLELSRGGRLAYVEAEYHGGEGEQRSMVWENGAAPREPEESSSAINDALSWLGVERSAGQDCFDTLGLGRHRSVEDWLADAPAPVDPAPPVPMPPRTHRPWWRFWR
jgi:hypothetical protein